MEVFGEISAQEVDSLVKRYCDYKLQPFKDFEILKHTVRTLGDSPQGFLGAHYYLEIHLGKASTSQNEKVKLKYFVKKVPGNVESFMQYIDDIQVFKKECTLFKELLPRLQDVNLKYGKFCPECYLVDENLVILENLADKKFRMGSPQGQLLDYPHLLCAMKTLANMHSACVVLEGKLQSQLIDLYPTCLTENSFPGWDKSSPRNTSLLTALKAICSLIEVIPKYKDSPELPKILEGFQKKFLQMPEFVRTSTRFRNVLLHGDLWANNLMFKYDSTGSPVDCRIVDFQLSRYGPPVLDILTVLSAATTSAFRKIYFDVLIENYYHFVDDFLTAHDINVNDLFTKIEFKESVNYYRIFGPLMSCYISHETLLPSEITKSLYTNSEMFKEFATGDRGKLCRKAFEIDPLYRERMSDMIIDIVDNFILKEYCEYNY
ncbi:unnamed protein product [Hermetia illucens]|uniref:CHK kinase-like domain-containing protein n=1 Tax=Hermetia illucens TaxID=343691 RepID=A0A7R8UMI2_HERIL|nr:uncharacterized protein LOC119648166 [Hermetia illucens]CAD7083570.1 unnamed protein product [Hermetia illucens]